MSSPRTPNYVLCDAVILQVAQSSGTKTVVLSPGTFIRPLTTDYVPKHTIEKYSSFNADKDVFCYTRYGIVSIPKTSIRET